MGFRRSVLALALGSLAACASGYRGGACDASDANLAHLQAVVCSSLTQSPTEWCGTLWMNATHASQGLSLLWLNLCGGSSYQLFNMPPLSSAFTRASPDWPNQAIYMNDLLDALKNTSTECLATPTAVDIVSWLDTSQADPATSGSWAWTYVDFQVPFVFLLFLYSPLLPRWRPCRGDCGGQVQYYDMPRQPGTRIESPGTLGRKCWAFAYLRQVWDPAPLNSALAGAGQSAENFVAMYEEAVPLTMDLCWDVMANCFVNATYDPSRNGTCPGAIDEFHYLGFDRENALRRGIVDYPFF